MNMKLAVEMCISVGTVVIQSRSLCVGQRRFPIFKHFCALRSLKISYRRLRILGDTVALKKQWGSN